MKKLWNIKGWHQTKNKTKCKKCKGEREREKWFDTKCRKLEIRRKLGLIILKKETKDAGIKYESKTKETNKRVKEERKYSEQILKKIEATKMNKSEIYVGEWRRTKEVSNQKQLFTRPIKEHLLRKGRNSK